MAFVVVHSLSLPTVGFVFRSDIVAVGGQILTAGQALLA